MVPRIKKIVSDSSVSEASSRKKTLLIQSNCNMDENGKRSDDKLHFLKIKKNALLNKFLTSK